VGLDGPSTPIRIEPLQLPEPAAPEPRLAGKPDKEARDRALQRIEAGSRRREELQAAAAERGGPVVVARLGGCPGCDVIPLSGKAFICEHGVIPARAFEVTMTMTIEDPDLYACLTEWFG
jgi:hypothetical protein